MIKIDRCGTFSTEILFDKGIKRSKKRKTKYFEIEFIIDANGRGYVNDESFPLKANTIIVAKPGVFRHSEFNFKCYCIYLNISKDDKYYELMFNTPTLFLNIDSTKYYHLFKRLNHLSETNGDFESDIYKAYVIELIYYLIEDTSSNIRINNIENNYSLIDKCVSFFESKYAEKITLNDLSKNIGYSPNYIQSKFKKLMGVTPLEYLETYRLNKAKKKIILSNESVLQIAIDHGFTSESYFIKRFKNKFGITPKEFRKKNISIFMD